MGKMSFAVTSLVAAIPGGILCYLLVMAFVSHAANLQLMSQIFIGLTLLCAATVALLPVGILIFGGRPAAKKSAAATGKKSKAAAVSDDEVVLDADDEEVLDADDDLEATSSFEPVVDEDEDFTEAVEAGSEEMFLESADDIEATSDDVFDAFDEDEPPAKGKKKR
jgi:hypothetical protein